MQSCLATVYGNHNHTESWQFDGFDTCSIHQWSEWLVIYFVVDFSDCDVNSDSTDTDSDVPDDGNASLTWTSATTDVVVYPFRPQQIGPAILLGPHTKPLDYFLAMFGTSTFVVLAKQTNLYATQVQDKAGKRDVLWTPTPEDGKKMRAFFAVNIMMGIISLP